MLKKKTKIISSIISFAVIAGLAVSFIPVGAFAAEKTEEEQTKQTEAISNEESKAEQLEEGETPTHEYEEEGEKKGENESLDFNTEKENADEEATTEKSEASTNKIEKETNQELNKSSVADENLKAESLIDSGVCGEDVKWKLDSEGTLTIEGTGNMYDFDLEEDVPWNEHRDLIKTVNIDYDVASIGNYAFKDCTNLMKIEIPGSVESIGHRAFVSCISLTDLSLSDHVRNIGDLAFFNCSNLRRIKLPLMITSIERRTFYNCSSLEEITIPDKVTAINEEAFASCYNLSSVTIGSDVNTIGNSAFNECISLTKTNYTGTIDEWVGIEFMKDNYNEFSSNPVTFSGNLYINDELVTEANITAATSISDYAFFGCKTLEKISLPRKFTNIGSNSLEGCTSLKSIDVDQYNKTYTSVDGILYNKDMTKIMTVPRCVTGNITIPDSITNIPDNTFSGCANITGVSIPNSITSIGNSVFNGCSSLLRLTIPHTITSIGDSAFNGCSSLASIVIPNSVSGNIDENAFNNCNMLAKIYFHGTEDEWNRLETGLKSGNVALVNAAKKFDYHQIDGACTYSGDEYHEYKCAYGGETVREAHIYDSGKITTEPTETEPGEKTYVCAICRHIKTEPVPAGVLVINDKNFPDMRFRSYVSTLEQGRKGYFTNEDIEQIKEININNSNIDNLNGIEYFTAIEKLIIQDSNINELDISKNSSLKYLDVRNNSISTLDIRENPFLVELVDNNTKIPLDSFYYYYDNDAFLYYKNDTKLQVYTVTFDTSGHDVSVESQVADKDGNIANPGAVTDNGYMVNGWYKDKECTRPWNFESSTVSGDMTLYSKWTEIPDNFVFINEENFPDEYFREYISRNFDKYNRGYLTPYVISGVTTIKLDDSRVESLKGIEYFPELANIHIGNSNLKELDISKNKALKVLYIKNNSLTELDTSNNTELQDLCVNDNEISELDLSQNTLLKTFDASNNNLTKLNVSNCKNLQKLSISENNIIELDIRNSPRLIGLVKNNNRQEEASRYYYSENNTGVVSLFLSYVKTTALKVFKVSFDMDDHGIQIEAQGVDKGGLVMKPEEPKDEGYTFIGWYSDKECTEEWNFNENTVNDNITIYAKWEKKDTCTLTFNTNGGSAIDELEKPKGAVIDLKDYTPTKKGSKFLGWYSDEELTKPITSITLTEDTTVYAKWFEYPEGSVIINEKNFPDNSFRSYISETFDKDKKGYLTKEEVAEVIEIDVSGMNIEKLNGIEFFTSLKTLDASLNKNLTSIDLSKNTELTKLDIDGCKITELDLSSNTKLTVLHADQNEITKVNISKNNKLKSVYLAENKLTKLDISGNPELEKLHVYGNKLTTLDLSKNEKLKYLNASYNELANINVSNNTALKELEIRNNKLTEVDVSKNVELIEISATGNNIASIDIRSNPKLVALVKDNKKTENDDGWVYYDPYAEKETALYYDKNTVLKVFDLTFEMNGHGTQIEPQTCDKDDKVTQPTTPTAAGYNFIGWYKNKECTESWNFSDDTVKDNTTLYAKWEKAIVNYTLTFNTNGGSAISAIKKPEGTTISLTTYKPTRSGYSFSGWYSDAKLTKSIISVKLTANTTVYAKWTALPLDKVTVSSAANTATGIQIKWNKSANAQGYKIYRKTGANGKWAVIKTVDANTTAYNDTAVNTYNGYNYVYAVRAYNGSGQGAYTAKACTRLAVRNLISVENTAAGRLTAKWYKNDKATGYVVLYQTGNTKKYAYVKGASSFYTNINGLTKGKTYTVYVRSYKTVNGVNYYSAWSAPKTVKITK